MKIYIKQGELGKKRPNIPLTKLYFSQLIACQCPSLRYAYGKRLKYRYGYDRYFNLFGLTGLLGIQKDIN